MMTEHGATFSKVREMDDTLVAGGLLPLSPWWQRTLARWYRNPTAKSLVARVGRAGIKSHTATKVALAETLFGSWNVPIGERHYFAFVSVNKTEAAQRLMLLEAMLRALGVQFDRSGEEISLRDRPLGFRVFACDVGAVSGFRCIGFVCDELSKWTADGSDPAVEVIASLQAMCTTHPAARKLLVSSPFGTLDEHYRRFELGDTREQVTAHAETWVANPSITKEQTQALEPDPRVWSREYAAIPGGTVNAAFDKDDVTAAFKLQQPPGYGPMSMYLDPSSLLGDEFAGAIVKETGGLVCVTEVFAYTAEHFTTMTLADVVQDIAIEAHARGIHNIAGDQRESAGLTSLFAASNIFYEPITWTEASKASAFLLLRRMLKDRKLAICPHDELKREMLRCKSHLLPSGGVRYQTSGLDYLSCLVTMAHKRFTTTSLGADEPRAVRDLRMAMARGFAECCPDESKYKPGGVDRRERIYGTSEVRRP